MTRTPILNPRSPLAQIPLSGSWEIQPVPLALPFVPADLDDHAWQSVPDCCHLQVALYPDNHYWGAHLRKLNERAWVYRRAFTAPDTSHRRARLRFEGVDYFASVWLNGISLGDHEGHFAPFEFDVTDILRPGEANTLLVRVSSPWDAPNLRGMYPADHVLRGLVKGLYEHGEGLIPPDVNPLGIWRPVSLLLDDGFSLDHLRIDADMNGEIDLRLAVSNTTGELCEGTLELEVIAENHDGDGLTASLPVELAPGNSQLTRALRFPAPRLWWPWDHGFPHLYRLRATLHDEHGRALCQREETFGFRSVRLERSPSRFTYYVNGRPVYIRGTSYLPDIYLSRCTRDSLERDVLLMREANLNLIRAHVHVAPPAFYDVCNRHGMLVWQDFELNWVHDPSPQFAARARSLQREMIDLLYNHPSIITWACHNEPSMVFSRRHNLEVSPDPDLYADACQQDPTRPVFICSGQALDDWQRSGDSHTYYGAIWTPRYTDIYGRRFRLNTEYGTEAPAAAETLHAAPHVRDTLRHLESRRDALWAYQAALTAYQTEYLRLLRDKGCGGYIHFWFADLVPQVGFGALDSARRPKGGWNALRLASQPLHVMLEHDGKRPLALWILNDTTFSTPSARLRWQMMDAAGALLHEGQVSCEVAANAAQHVTQCAWPVAPRDCEFVHLSLEDGDGKVLAENHYTRPFQPLHRPRGYPWNFDRVLGMKVYDHPAAGSLADMSDSRLIRVVPLRVRETFTEWILRQQFPTWLASLIARGVDAILS